MKILNGFELAGYIKERQLKQVRSLRQSMGVIPKLAIVQTGDDPVIDMYVRLKQSYGEDITAEVEVYKPADSELIDQIRKLNIDTSIHGIIVQLPLNDPNLTDDAINAVAIEKDVDGLRDNSLFIPATANAINWLLAGYNVALDGKKIVIVGKGRLVGAPLAKLWRDSNYDVTVCDSKTLDLASELKSADVIVTAVGIPGLVTSDMIHQNVVVVDAGTSSENGVIVGDLASDVRDRQDLTITPIKGGVGPLTVTALFDNVIIAAKKAAENSK